MGFKFCVPNKYIVYGCHTVRLANTHTHTHTERERERETRKHANTHA